MKRLIIFSHHFVNEFVTENFNKLKNLNPDWDIISVGFPNYNLLSNSLIVNKYKYPTNHDLKFQADRDYTCERHIDWFDADLFLYETYFQFPNYDAYFLYEYDTISNVSIDDFFDTSLDFFGNDIWENVSESYYWLNLYRLLNQYNSSLDNISTWGQCTAIYVTNKILKNVVNEIINNKHLYCNMLSEIRGGTLIKKFTSLKRGKHNIREFISWEKSLINIDLSIPHFFHPVK